MIQCRACSSYNDEEAAFCNQCGGPLGRRRSSGHRRRWTLVATACLPLLACGIGLYIYQAWESRRPRARAPSAAAAPARPAEAPAPKARDTNPAEPAEPEPLAEPALRRVVDSAVVKLELFDASGDRLREQPGVLLEGGTTVVARFRPLLGAYAGTARSARWSNRAREVVGIVALDPHANLALVEIRSPAGSQAAGAAEGLAPSDLGTAAIRPGAELWTCGEVRPAPARVSENPYYTPDGVAHVRLEEDSALSPSALLATDPYGGVIGLCVSETGSVPSAAQEDGSDSATRPRLLVDLLSGLAAEVGRPAKLTLADATRQFHENTFADFLERGRKALEADATAQAVDLLDQALEAADREGLAVETAEPARALLRRALEGELDRRRGEKDLRGMLRFLGIATRRFSDERRFWLELGAVHLELGDEREAVPPLLEARRLLAGTDADTLLLKAYRDASQKELELGRSQLAGEWLEKGLQVLPDSARLRLDLAGLYQRWGLLDDAARVFQEAAALDPAVSAEVEAALERIVDLARRREALVLEIPPGSSSIQADVVLNGAASYRFVIDTGATYTAISQQIANALGYQITPTTERLMIGTANGVIHAPLIVLDSVNLHGYAVRNVKAIVLPDKAQSQVGLLGLNFLNNFRYSVDAGKREFRLEKR